MIHLLFIAYKEYRILAFAILIWWIVTNTNVQPADPADGSPFPSPFEG